MSLFHKRWFSIGILLISAGACVKSANLENDDESSSSSSSTVRDAGGRDAGSTTRRDAATSSTDDEGDDDTSSDDDSSSSSDDDSTPSRSDAGSSSGRTDAGTTPSKPPAEISGTAPKNSCTSTTAAKGEMCSSHFCGITADDLASAIDPDSPCGSAEQACEQGAELAKSVTDCSIMVKASAANLGKTNEQLRPLVQACVYKVEEIKDTVNEECLGCFLDVAECAGTNCLTECLVGTPKQCDACRISKGCEEPLFKCAGLPNPL